MSMNGLNNANESPAEQLNVRIVLLPPFTVASSHGIGKEPEETVGNELDRFIRGKKLYEIKPDSRYFMFKHPNPGILPNDERRCEAWVTIPDDMEVPAPLVKKRFGGGLYAVHAIQFPEFYRWGELEQWANESGQYEADYSGTDKIMSGCLEELLNRVYSSYIGICWGKDGIDGQVDLFLPIRFR